MNDTPPNSQPEQRSSIWAIAEVAFIFLVFFLFAGATAPDVNEAHYLAKAKHYWNPEWGQGDLFLESKDAHLAFNWTLGWLTLWLPLPAVAWAGRIITWLLLAWSWQRLSFSLVPRKLFSILTAAMFLLLIQRFHLAGEWVVGGVEAKGFAFVCVFLVLDSMVRSRWRQALVLCGLATFFHVLVGGWSLMAMSCAWIAVGRDRPGVFSLAPFAMIALLIASPSVIAGLSLSWGVDKATVQEANRIYVFERLSHHLAPHTFLPSAIRLPFSPQDDAQRELIIPSWFICRHLALLFAWVALCLGIRRDQRQVTLQGFVAGSVVIAAVGCGMDFLSLFEPELGASLLKYYWFRLSDAVVPIGVTFALLGLLLRLEADRQVLVHWSLVALILVAAANVGEVLLSRSKDLRPPADRQSMAILDGDPSQANQRYEDWLRACNWVNENTSPDSQFLTPHFQQTFKWNTARREVANWKDVPQDAPALVAWWNRYQEIYPPTVRVFGLAAHRDRRLQELALQYDAQYILLDRTRYRRNLDAERFVKLYPNQLQANESYEIYWVRLDRR